MSNNPVVHFEMPYKDGARVTKFYQDAFGWGMQDTGESMGNYITAATADTDQNRMVMTPGAINGGFYPISDAPDSPEPSFVISVDDVSQALADVKAAGGSVLREPSEIPGVGTWATFRDSEGNRVSVLQATQAAQS